MKYLLFKKIIALITSLTFLWPGMSWAFDSVNYRTAGNPLQQINHLGRALQLDAALGLVKESYQGQGKTILCIQDLHCNYEVQKNISKIIGRFAQSQGLKLVGEEGATGTVQVDALRDFPLRRIAEEVGDYFVRQGRLTGAEQYAAVGPQPIKLVGVETTSLYDASLKTVQSFLNSETQGYIEDLREALEELKPALYPPALQEYDQPCRDYRQGKLDLLQYVLHLKKQARILNITESQFPQLKLFLQAGQPVFSSAICAEDFFREIELLDQQIRDQLATSPQARRLDELARRLEIIEKVLNISATPAEVAFFRQQRADFKVAAFTDFIQTAAQDQTWDPEVYGLDQALDQAAAFYLLADQRSVCFVDNLLQAMDQEHENLAVMVNGGFHIAGITRELKRRQISFLSIEPRLTRQDLVNPYFSLLQGKKLSLEKLLEKNQSILQIPSWPQAGRQIFSRCTETAAKALAQAETKNTLLEQALQAYETQHHLIERKPWQSSGTPYANLKNCTIFTAKDQVSQANVYLLVASRAVLEKVRHQLEKKIGGVVNSEDISPSSSFVSFVDMTQLNEAAKLLEQAAVQVGIAKRISDLLAAMVESFITFPIALATKLGAAGLEPWFDQKHPEYKQEALRNAQLAANVAWSIPVALLTVLAVIAGLIVKHHSPAEVISWGLAVFLAAGGFSHMPRHLSWNWLNPHLAGNLAVKTHKVAKEFDLNEVLHSLQATSITSWLGSNNVGYFEEANQAITGNRQLPVIDVFQSDHIVGSFDEAEKRLKLSGSKYAAMRVIDYLPMYVLPGEQRHVSIKIVIDTVENLSANLFLLARSQAIYRSFPMVLEFNFTSHELHLDNIGINFKQQPAQVNGLELYQAMSATLSAIVPNVMLKSEMITPNTWRRSVQFFSADIDWESDKLPARGQRWIAFMKTIGVVGPESAVDPQTYLQEAMRMTGVNSAQVSGLQYLSEKFYDFAAKVSKDPRLYAKLREQFWGLPEQPGAVTNREWCELLFKHLIVSIEIIGRVPASSNHLLRESKPRSFWQGNAPSAQNRGALRGASGEVVLEEMAESILTAMQILFRPGQAIAQLAELEANELRVFWRKFKELQNSESQTLEQVLPEQAAAIRHKLDDYLQNVLEKSRPHGWGWLDYFFYRILGIPTAHAAVKRLQQGFDIEILEAAEGRVLNPGLQWLGAFNLPGLLKAGLTGEAARNLAKDPDQAAAVILHEALEAAGLSHLETEILVRAATGYSTNQLIKAAGLPKMRAPEHAVHRGLTTRLEVISPAARLEPKTTVQLEGVKLDRVDSGRDRAIRAEMERMLTGVRGRADHSSVAVVKTISVRDQRLSIIKPADLPDSNLHPYGAFQQNHEAFLTSDALERLSPAQAAVIFLIASLTAAGVQPNRAEELVLQSSGFTREKLLRALASNLLPLARQEMPAKAPVAEERTSSRASWENRETFLILEDLAKELPERVREFCGKISVGKQALDEFSLQTAMFGKRKNSEKKADLDHLAMDMEELAGLPGVLEEKNARTIGEIAFFMNNLDYHDEAVAFLHSVYAKISKTPASPQALRLVGASEMTLGHRQTFNLEIICIWATMANIRLEEFGGSLHDLYDFHVTFSQTSLFGVLMDEVRQRLLKQEGIRAGVDPDSLETAMRFMDPQLQDELAIPTVHYLASHPKGIIVEMEDDQTWIKYFLEHHDVILIQSKLDMESGRRKVVALIPAISPELEKEFSNTLDHFEIKERLGLAPKVTGTGGLTHGALRGEPAAAVVEKMAENALTAADIMFRPRRAIAEISELVEEELQVFWRKFKDQQNSESQTLEKTLPEQAAAIRHQLDEYLQRALVQYRPRGWGWFNYFLHWLLEMPDSYAAVKRLQRGFDIEVFKSSEKGVMNPDLQWLGAFNFPGLLKACLTREAAYNLAKDPAQAAAVILHEALEAAKLSHGEAEILVEEITGYSTMQLIKAAELPEISTPDLRNQDEIRNILLEQALQAYQKRHHLINSQPWQPAGTPYSNLKNHTIFAAIDAVSGANVFLLVADRAALAEAQGGIKKMKVPAAPAEIISLSSALLSFADMRQLNEAAKLLEQGARQVSITPSNIGGLMPWLRAWYAQRGLARQYDRRAKLLEEAPRLFLGLLAFLAILTAVLMGVLDIRQGLVGMIFLANNIAWGFFPMEHLLPKDLLVENTGKKTPTDWVNVGISVLIAGVNILFSLAVATQWGVTIYTLALSLLFGPLFHGVVNKVLRILQNQRRSPDQLLSVAAVVGQTVAYNEAYWRQHPAAEAVYQNAAVLNQDTIFDMHFLKNLGSNIRLRQGWWRFKAGYETGQDGRLYFTIQYPFWFEKLFTEKKPAANKIGYLASFWEKLAYRGVQGALVRYAQARRATGLTETDVRSLGKLTDTLVSDFAREKKAAGAYPVAALNRLNGFFRTSPLYRSRSVIVGSSRGVLIYAPEDMKPATLARYLRLWPAMENHENASRKLQPKLQLRWSGGA